MMLHQLSPETLFVVAGCMEFWRMTGNWPAIEKVELHAKAARASVGACLVLTRNELRAADGSVVPLMGCEDCMPPAVVPDVETAYAILLRDSVRVLLQSPEGRRIPLRKLSAWASARSYCR